MPSQEFPYKLIKDDFSSSVTTFLSTTYFRVRHILKGFFIYILMVCCTTINCLTTNQPTVLFVLVATGGFLLYVRVFRFLGQKQKPV